MVNIERHDFNAKPPYKRGDKLKKFTNLAYLNYRNCTQSLIRDKVYHASSEKFKSNLEDSRLRESRSVLKSIGGKSIVIRTCDGTNIEAMYFSVLSFRKIISDMGGEFDYQQLPGNIRQQTLNVKTTRLLNLCHKLRLKVSEGMSKKVCFARPEGYDHNRRIDTNRSVSILTQGNAGIFEMDRRTIAQTLLTGQNCIVYNIRGTGRSQGKPTEIGTYFDIEAIYQYLIRVKRFSDPQITVVGYCLGGGAAVELAKNHPLINLTLDRSFLRISDICAEVVKEQWEDQLKAVGAKDSTIQQLSSWVSRAISWFVISYDNESKIPAVRGNVCILGASEDDVIPSESPAILYRRTMAAANQKNITIQGGHCSPWDPLVEQQYAEHLSNSQVLNDFGVTKKWSLQEIGSLFTFSGVPVSSNGTVGAVEQTVLMS